jgi:hypothetical protein
MATSLQASLVIISSIVDSHATISSQQLETAKSEREERLVRETHLIFDVTNLKKVGGSIPEPAPRTATFLTRLKGSGNHQSARRYTSVNRLDSTGESWKSRRAG